ncbi:MAG: hypothetical protein ACRDMZ_15525, partial [Solirubrobacteraceae bacterium]
DLWETAPSRAKVQPDKTGWAPPGTAAPLAHQWIAVLGLGLLPVAHRPMKPSLTPGCWPKGRGVTLPLLSHPSSLARARALVGLSSLTAITADGGDAAISAVAELRAMSVGEVVAFARVMARGQGSSVAFSFSRGRRIAL